MCSVWLYFLLLTIVTMVDNMEVSLALARAKVGLFYFAEQLLNIRAALLFLETSPQDVLKEFDENMEEVVATEENCRPKKRAPKRKKKPVKKVSLPTPTPSTWQPSAAPLPEEDLEEELDLVRDMPTLHTTSTRSGAPAPTPTSAGTGVTLPGWQEMLREETRNGYNR